MVSKAQKEVQCDHCGTSQGSKSVFSAQKVFLGRKITDVLETITHRSIPASLPIKICFVCTSTFMSSAALIEKVRETVDRIQGQPAKKRKASENEEADKKAVKVQHKNTTIRLRSKSIAAIPASFINGADAEIKINNDSPKKLDKTPKKHLSRPLEDDLNDSVKLTPAKELSSTKKVFLNLFGNGDNDAIEVLTESEEEEDAGKGPITINTNNFECVECAFHSKFPNPYKEHLQKEHGLQRPRIYSCTLCIKTFGVLKTLKTHLRDAHSRTFETEAVAKAKAKENKEKESEAKKKSEAKAKEPKTVSQSKKPKEGKSKGKKTEEIKSKNETKVVKEVGDQEVNSEKGTDSKDADKTQAPKIASFQALNESFIKKRMLENVIDSEYTFAINGSSASTPRADSIHFRCEICDCELTTSKQMQGHMKTAHGVVKPKVFKCHVCEKSLATKQSLKTHMALHGEGAEVSNSSKRMILQEGDEDVDILGTSQREDTTKGDKGPKQSLQSPATKGAKSSKVLQEDEVVEILDAFQSNNTAEDDEGPTEEQIIRTKNQVDGSMIAPRSPAKKAKKGTTSHADLSVSSTNGSSSSRSEKRKKEDKSKDTLPTYDVDVVEEINYNVKPHKKARLESISDSTADESVLSCDQCGKFVKSRQRLDSHMEKKHASQLKCPICKEIYNNQMDYVAHFSDCGSESGLPCGVAHCKKVFMEANYLSSHLRKRHQLH